MPSEMILVGVSAIGLLLAIISYVGTLDRRDEERRRRDLAQWWIDNEVRRDHR